MTINVNDVIEVVRSQITGSIESLPNEWVYGLNKTSQQSGYFLGDYVQYSAPVAPLRPKPAPRSLKVAAQPNDSGYASPHGMLLLLLRNMCLLNGYCYLLFYWKNLFVVETPV